MQDLDIKKIITEHEIETVIIMGTDPSGVQRGKRIPVSYFLDVMSKGVRFSSFVMSSTTSDDLLPDFFETGVPDIGAEFDLSTFRVATWESQTAICMINWVALEGGAPDPRCPRGQLIKQVEALKARGLEASSSVELEFYVLPVAVEEVKAGNWSDFEPEAKDYHCYSVYDGYFWENIVAKIRQCFPQEVESCMPEFERGQLEITLRHTDPVKMADTVAMFKTAVKQIVAKEGQTVTFMAKWHHDFAGSSGHIHMSLRDIETGDAVFYDPDEEHNMSLIFKQFLAGQMDLFRSGTLFYAPYINSYRRFKKGSFAGIYNAWGVDNRTATFRVFNDSKNSCRFEHRLGGADLNPYSSLAFMIAAGLRGVDEALELPSPIEGNCEGARDVLELAPVSMEEAILAAKSDANLKRSLSEEYIENIIRVSELDLNNFNNFVTDVERRRYLEMA
jgi:glutamine synthetase